MEKNLLDCLELGPRGGFPVFRIMIRIIGDMRCVGPTLVNSPNIP